MNTELINIGNKQLEIYKKGDGHYTIVFELGCGDTISNWEHIANTLSQEYSILLYHRSGYGKSSINRDRISSFNSIIDDFNRLLDTLRIKNNIILVAHSFGGACAQKFLINNPDILKGIVLVDSSPLDYAELELIKKQMPNINEKYNTDNQIEGLKALSHKSTEELIKDGHKGIFQNPDSYYALWSEYDLLRSNSVTEYEQLFNCSTSMKIILSDKNVGIEKLTNDNIPSDEALLFETICEKMKSQPLDLSRNSELIIAENSGHQVHIDDPQLIIDTVKRLIQEL